MIRNRRAVTAALLVVVSATFVVAGCTKGGSGGTPIQTGRPLTAADIPTKPGLNREYFSNDPKVNQFVGVSFTFNGPWDFTLGPTDSLVASKFLEVRNGIDHKEFPKATIAMVTAIKGQERFLSDSYFSKTAEAYSSYGQANARGINVFPTPEAILKFPLAVGKSWSDRIMLQSTPPTELEVNRKVVGQGSITVPAGTFKDTVMIQIRKTLTQTDGSSTTSLAYEWYAPGVGIVAWIAGRNDEPGPLFKEAAFFQRLKAYTK